MRTRRPVDFTSIPEPFGTSPTPSGSVRVNHYTSDDAIGSIRQHGLTMEHARASYERGTTEYPSIFATAGTPKGSLLRDRPVVEANIPLADLDIGGVPSAWKRSPEEVDQKARALEAGHSVVTMNQDLPPSNIVAIHEPWHQTFRYIQGDPSMEQNIMAGHYDDTGEDAADTAIDATKVALAGKVMLGGALGGRQWNR